MPSAQPPPTGQQPGTQVMEGQGQGQTAANESSKFRRFLKRFGRRPSEEGGESDAHAAQGIQGEEGGENAKKTGSMRSRRGSKTGTTKGKRSDSLAGRFFPSSSNNAPPLPNAGKHGANANAAGGNAAATNATSDIGARFEGTDVKGLASTLTLPSSDGAQAPQLDGLPRHDPIAASDLMPAGMAAPLIPADGHQLAGVPASSGPTNTAIADGSSQTATDASGTANGVESSTETDRDAVALSPQSSYASSHSRAAPSFDNESAHGRVRDSVDNRTMDTQKSRASTKPTTLMSMDTRENQPGGSYTPMAQIAQHRHGDNISSQQRVASLRNGDGGTNAHPAIQFASAPPMGRTASGTIVQLPGQGEAPAESPYTNVPSLSRPHPANNPHPTGVPADNASVLTLASSTAAASIGGGPASSRGHSHAAPSLGGARSIGGSLMGERRNSSDTYASVKALPPLSRRGSDSSSRTGRSVAASATGRNSAQAMTGAGSLAGAGPGAPGDRISIHRTPSQKTIATQLSIPLSTSNQALSTNPTESGGQNASSSSSHLEAGAHLTAPNVSSGSQAFSALQTPQFHGSDIQRTPMSDTPAAHAESRDETDAGATLDVPTGVPSITTTQASPGEELSEESARGSARKSASSGATSS